MYISSDTIKEKCAPRIPVWDNTFNLGHNILEPYNVLVQVRFTPSKTKCDV